MRSYFYQLLCKAASIKRGSKVNAQLRLFDIFHGVRRFLYTTFGIQLCIVYGSRKGDAGNWVRRLSSFIWKLNRHLQSVCSLESIITTTVSHKTIWCHLQSQGRFLYRNWKKNSELKLQHKQRRLLWTMYHVLWKVDWGIYSFR